MRFDKYYTFVLYAAQKINRTVFNAFNTVQSAKSFRLAENSPVAINSWQQYQDFAIPFIEQQTELLRAELSNLDNITPIDAHKDLAFMDVIAKELQSQFLVYDSINKADFTDFKAVFTNFYTVFTSLYNHLSLLSEHHIFYLQTQEVFSLDWNREEDSHWDNL